MKRITRLEPRSRYRLWLHYDDGTEGVVDLSHLVGKGVFVTWKDASAFAAVRIGEHGAPEWPGDVDLCPDALYLEITGKGVENLGRTPQGVLSA